MTDDRPPSSFLVTAQIRIAAKEGVPIMVRQRGDDGGAILLKVNRLDGTAHVLSQARMGDEVVWNPVSRTDPLPDADAENYLEKQAKMDPDIWILEIEDRAGRHWFPGKRVTL